MASGEVQWDNLEPASGDPEDTTQLAALQPTNEGGVRKLKRFPDATKWRDYFLKTLTDATYSFINGLSLTPGRVAMQESPSAFTASNNGWHTVLESTGSAISAFGRIYGIATSERGMACKFGVRAGGSGGAGSAELSSIEILGDFSNAKPNVDFGGYRIISSSSDQSAGWAIQVDLISGVSYHFKLSDNFSSASQKGAVLITPRFDNVLPDGSTVADTFIEAGAQYELSSALGTRETGIFGLRVSNDQVVMWCDWGEIPKQGTTIFKDFTDGIYRLRWTGNNILLDNTYTFTSPEFTANNKVTWTLNKVGAFSTIGANDLLHLTSANDAGGTLDIS